MWSRVWARGSARVWQWRIGLGLFLIYLLLGMIFWHTLVAHFTTYALGAGGGDASLFISWLQWAAHAVTNDLNPLRNDYIQAPSGVSAVWNTSVLALGIPLTPVTLLFGAPFSYNVVILLSPVLSCWTASKWLRRHVSTIPAAIAALIFGFSPFELGQLAGHAHLSFLAMVPLIVMALEDLLIRSERPIWPAAPLLAVAVTVQFFISSEMLLMLALSVVPAVLLLTLGRLDVARVRAIRVAIAGLAAVVLVVGLLAVALVEQFSDTYRIDSPILDAGKRIGKVWWLFHPTAALYFHGSTPAPGAVENGTYIGWPLLLALVITVIVLRRRLAIWVALLVAVFAVVNELGPKVAGNAVSPLALLQQNVPLTANILPTRFASIFALAAAFLLAVGLQELLTRAPGRRWLQATGARLVVAVLGSLLPGAARPVGQLIDTPAFFTSDAMRQIIPEGSTVMLAPMASPLSAVGQHWQSESGMWFKQLGGYDLNNQGSGIPSYYPRQRTLVQLFGTSLVGKTPFSRTKTRHLVLAARQELADSGATFFVLGASNLGMDEQRDYAELLLERVPDIVSGDVEIWRLTQDCGQDVKVGPVCPSTN